MYPIRPKNTTFSCFLCDAEPFKSAMDLQHHLNEKHLGWAESVIKSLGFGKKKQSVSYMDRS
jgi:hypothetical protein